MQALATNMRRTRLPPLNSAGSCIIGAVGNANLLLFLDFLRWITRRISLGICCLKQPGALLTLLGCLSLAIRGNGRCRNQIQNDTELCVENKLSVYYDYYDNIYII